jgi:hypothetical protein
MEVAMRTNVTGTLWTVVAAAAVLLVAAPAARAQDEVMATVPFDFVVGTARMPAGDYMISEQSDGVVIKIDGRRNHQASFALTMSGFIDATFSQPELVFDKSGETYFLERIVVAPGNVRELPLPPAMKARAAERVAVASAR